MEAQPADEVTTAGQSVSGSLGTGGGMRLQSVKSLQFLNWTEEGKELNPVRGISETLDHCGSLWRAETPAREL